MQNAPPYAFAAIVALTISWYADKVNLRGPFIIAQALITAVGLLMVAYAQSNAARYIGVFLGVAGAAGNVPAILAYVRLLFSIPSPTTEIWTSFQKANNVVGQSKRAFSSALVIGFGGVGGIFATTAFRQQDFPDYRNGMWAAIGCQFLMISLVIATSIHFYRANEGVRTGTRGVIEGRSGFRYTL